MFLAGVILIVLALLFGLAALALDAACRLRGAGRVGIALGALFVLGLALVLE